MVAKVAHANPMPVMEAVVTQIEVYDNQIEVSLEALKYLSPLSYDVLTFVILSRCVGVVCARVCVCGGG